MLAVVLRSPPGGGLSMITAGVPSTTPVPSAISTPRIAPPAPQFAYGKDRSGGVSGGFGATGSFASMPPAVSQVSRSTRTRLRFLRRLVIVVVLIVVGAI